MNKVELFRQGEATLEKFYPPWMKVIYYRYLRFFSDGTMLMHTSAADPITTIPLLKNPKAHVDGMCKGMYRIKDNQVHILMFNQIIACQNTDGFISLLCLLDQVAKIN